MFQPEEAPVPVNAMIKAFRTDWPDPEIEWQMHLVEPRD
jgi:hypothetical protein